MLKAEGIRTGVTSKLNTAKSDFTQGNIFGKLILFMIPILGALIGGSIVVFAIISCALFVIMLCFSTNEAVVQNGYDYLKGFAAPAATIFGIILNVAFCIWSNRPRKFGSAPTASK